VSAVTASWLRARFVGVGGECHRLEALLADLTEDGQATWTFDDNPAEVGFVLGEWVPHRKACREPVQDRHGAGTSVHSRVDFTLIYQDGEVVPAVVVRCSAMYPTDGVMTSSDDAYRQLYTLYAQRKH
jgi:hypothetical protein